MKKSFNVVIKICNKATSFLVSSDKKIIFWSTVSGGEHHIINDVSQCLRLKFNDAELLTKAKGVCLSEAIGIKEDKVLAEVIEARVEEIFNEIKEELRTKGLLEKVSCFFITKDDNYIPDMDKLLNKVMEIDVKCVDLACVTVTIKSEANAFSKCYTKFTDEYF